MENAYDSQLHRLMEQEFRTITGLAKATGIERTRLHHIVHGRVASESEAAAIADALQRSPEECGLSRPAADAAA